MTSGGTLYDVILRTEAEWIAGLQLSNGAIPTYNQPLSAYGNKYKVVPYFAHFALLGLLENPVQTQVVRHYISWYFDHLNRLPTAKTPEGSVYDYVIEMDRVTETPTNDFDSTDSYASTFLNVLRKYAETTSDITYLQAYKGDIELVGGAMVATLDADGLTWAKPEYQVKYLMDNAEVYAGLCDLEWIGAVAFGDDAAAARYRMQKEHLAESIEREFWNESKKAYAYAKLNDGTLLHADWSIFYPDATAQLFPIWTGLLAPDSPRAQLLYDHFNACQPVWPQLRHADRFPWSLLAYTAAVMGDRIRADRFLDSIQSAYVECGHPWPWYAMESGVSMLTAARLKKLV